MFFLSRSKKDKSIDMSIPQADELYGIKIVKLPVVLTIAWLYGFREKKIKDLMLICFKFGIFFKNNLDN